MGVPCWGILHDFASVASFASRRNLEKNPEANWFVNDLRLVSLCNLTWRGCKFSKYCSNTCMYAVVWVPS